MMQEFVQQVRNLVDGMIREIHTAMPAEIVSFDTTTGLATVLPIMKFRKPDGSTVNYPQISGVPVLFPQALGGDAVIAFPVQAGDSCLIIVAEQAIDYWLYGQETDTNLAFDMTNAICIPGLFNTGNPLVADACSENAIMIALKHTRLTVRDGEVDINADTVKVSGNLVVEGTVTSKQ